MLAAACLHTVTAAASGSACDGWTAQSLFQAAGAAQTSSCRPPPSPARAGGINEQTYVRLRSEAKAPFRLTRIIFLGGLAVGAALGLFIITSRLLAALAGGWHQEAGGWAMAPHALLLAAAHMLPACHACCRCSRPHAA